MGILGSLRSGAKGGALGIAHIAGMTQQTFQIPACGKRPPLFVRRQPRSGAPPVLYVHGATFPSALSAGFDFGGGSWMDDWNARGLDAWAFDFAGFGESGRWPAMREPADHRPPLGRAADAVEQVTAVLALIHERTGRSASLVAHSWGSMPAGLAATKAPQLVDRLVLFGPIARRAAAVPLALPAWSDITIEAQHARFIEDVPEGHPPMLAAFDRWAPAYLASDPEAATRMPPAVRIPNGPRADNLDALSGRLAWDPARLTRPLHIVRGAWDSLCRDPDATMLLKVAVSAPERSDRKLEAGTHLMHLENGRRALYEAVGQALKGATP